MSFLQTSEIPSRDLFPGVHAKLIHTVNTTIAYVTLDKGVTVPEHAHIHEQIINVLEGTFEMTLDGETRTVTAGHVGVVPSNVKHTVTAITGGKIIDVFSPVREDLK
ncbi:MAG TPA: cupin domain-containing protein [Chitinophagales bacterium]|nr:cupin domain-containing protein [Chitinophagales bacterium]